MTVYLHFSNEKGTSHLHSMTSKYLCKNNALHGSMVPSSIKELPDNGPAFQSCFVELPTSVGAMVEWSTVE